MKEWKLKKQEAKAKKELDEKEGKSKTGSGGNEKTDKPKELDTPLMNQAEIESTMAEYEVRNNCWEGRLISYVRKQNAKNIRLGRRF